MANRHAWCHSLAQQSEFALLKKRDVVATNWAATATRKGSAVTTRGGELSCLRWLLSARITRITTARVLLGRGDAGTVLSATTAEIHRGIGAMRVIGVTPTAISPMSSSGRT
jgi:hypothetical protein